MVGVIKSKGPQTQTKAAGVLNINTGADQVASALGRAADRVGQVAYQKFEDEQTELGKKQARGMKMRDEKGNIIYQDITSDMTRVARNAAQPIIQERYGRQLGLDMDRALIDLRADVNAHQNDPEKFRELAGLRLEGMISNVPQDFADVGQMALDSVGAERTMDHYNQLTRAKIKEEEAVAISNMLVEVSDDVKTIQALIANGDVDTALDLADSSRKKAGLLIGMGGNLSQQNAAIKAIDTVVYGEQANLIANELIAEGSYDLLDAMAESFEGNAIVDPDRQVVIAEDNKQITMSLREALARKGITDEYLRNIDDVEVRGAVAAAIRTRANQYSSRQRDLVKLANMQQLVQDQMNGSGFAETGSKAEDAVESVLTQTMTREQMVSAEGAAMAQDPNSTFGKILRNGAVFPTSVKKQLINAAQAGANPKTASELRNLLTIWATGSMGITKNGPVVRSKLSNEVNAFWKNVNNYAMSFGMEAATEYATALTSGSTTKQDLENQARINLGNTNKDAYAQITQRWSDEGWIEDKNPRAISRLKTIAIRAYASLPIEEADDYIDTAYETLFAPTDYIRTPAIMGAAKQDRSEFAPERFYGDELMPSFLDHVNKKLKGASGSFVLGDNAFLYPSPDSTNSSVTWQVIDKQGKPILNSNGQILIRSQALNKDSTMANKFAQGVNNKIEEARALRDKAMSGPQTGIEAKAEGLNIGAGLIDSLLGRQ